MVSTERSDSDLSELFEIKENILECFCSFFLITFTNLSDFVNSEIALEKGHKNLIRLYTVFIKKNI